MKDSSLFISRLKDLMDEKGLSVNKLAKAIQCDNQAIARWLAGQYYPRHYILIKMAEYFYCSVDFLLGLTNDESFSKSKKSSDFLTQFIKRRNLLNLTDYQIAKQIDIEQSTISKWLIRKQIPETNTLINLSAVLECSVDFLLGRSDN